MNCVVCKHGELVPGTATQTIDSNGTVFVLRHVPALVCDVCGEEYLEEEVSRTLLGLAEEARHSGAAVVVKDFVQAA